MAGISTAPDQHRKVYEAWLPAVVTPTALYLVFFFQAEDGIRDHLGATSAAEGGGGQAWRHGRKVRQAHGGGRPADGAVSGAQRPRREGSAEAGGSGEGGGGVSGNRWRLTPALL